MIEPETSEQLLDKIHNGGTVTLTRGAHRDGWFQQVRDEKGQLIYVKDVSTHFGKEEVLEEWWGYNEAGQVTYTKDSEGIECWNDYDKEGKCCGYKDNRGKSSGTLAADSKTPSVEQRLEAIESSLDHLSQQMKLIIKAMSAEYKLGEYD